MAKRQDPKDKKKKSIHNNPADAIHDSVSKSKSGWPAPGSAARKALEARMDSLHKEHSRSVAKKVGASLPDSIKKYQSRVEAEQRKLSTFREAQLQAGVDRSHKRKMQQKSDSIKTKPVRRLEKPKGKK